MDEHSQYWPAISGGKVARRFRFGHFGAVVLTNPKSLSSVQYLYVMPVFRSDEGTLCLCVAAERNMFYAAMKASSNENADLEGSHFLGLFPGDGHVNLGSSNDWADLDRFTTRALEVARHHLGAEEEAIEEFIKKPWWRFW